VLCAVIGQTENVSPIFLKANDQPMISPEQQKKYKTAKISLQRLARSCLTAKQVLL
jgi:hypothetical protein